jgi:U2 small nuclear ribonucleoprotein A'
VLTQNRLADLTDLVPLGQFRKLTHLVLHENPVTRHEHYRHWVLWRCRNVRFLDFQKVKQAERERAIELFGESESAPTDLARTILSSAKAGTGAASARTGVANGLGDGSTSGRVKLTAAERKRVEAMIRNAKSLSEIAKLEKELNEGRIPGGVIDDEMEE